MPQSSASYTHDIHTRATVLYQNLETESNLDHDLGLSGRDLDLVFGGRDHDLGLGGRDRELLPALD